jgi:hypothetical protein
MRIFRQAGGRVKHGVDVSGGMAVFFPESRQTDVVSDQPEQERFTSSLGYTLKRFKLL